MTRITAESAGGAQPRPGAGDHPRPAGGGRLHRLLRLGEVPGMLRRLEGRRHAGSGMTRPREERGMIRPRRRGGTGTILRRGGTEMTRRQGDIGTTRRQGDTGTTRPRGGADKAALPRQGGRLFGEGGKWIAVKGGRKGDM